jgi:hypothetical protein
VFLMTGGTGDVPVSRNLVLMVLTDAMAHLALAIVDRVFVVAEVDQPLQRRPGCVASPAFVLDQSMRPADVTRLINLVLSLNVLQPEPKP